MSEPSRKYDLKTINRYVKWEVGLKMFYAETYP
ncbi:hypothetical protein R69919_03908 [Paraburkholderia gardini]|nr:hypothetical protein R69919_03908 [Paraburkholderia gardini]